MKETRLTIANKDGLHARPAAMFVGTARKYQSSIMVSNLSVGSAWVDAKSILEVLTLGVYSGHSICVQAEGVDEAEAVMAISELVDGRFAS